MMFAGARSALAALGLVAIGFSQDSNSHSSRDRGLAAVVRSASTNTDGLRILVERSGRTQTVIVPHRPPPQPVELPETTIGSVRAELARRLYADLDAAWPISKLPKPNCAKSASFGTRLLIEFDYQSTPDLSCTDGGNAKLRALARDAEEIVKASGNR